MHSLRLGTIAVGCSLLCTLALAAEDENGVTAYTDPVASKADVAKAVSEMKPKALQPPDNRWLRLPRTASTLKRASGELKILMLGDSIVNDTYQSRWGDLLRAAYPQHKIELKACVRGSTGCWWYKDPGRLNRYVLSGVPDLLIIGGISHRDDVDSIRELIDQVRKAQPCDVLVVTGAFGRIDPRDDKQWSFDIDPNSNDDRARLKRLADELRVSFVDMSALWGRYIRESGKDLDYFKRDPIHANARGSQIQGQIMAAALAPPVP